STASQFGFTATPGPDGSLFSGGIVFGVGFPTSVGAYDGSYNPGGRQGVDMGIFKFNPTGTGRIYATYLGGDNDDYPHSIIADAQGNLVILGRSYSENSYPATKVGTGGGADIVVTKLNAAGSGLIGSLRIGGSEADGVNVEDQQRGTRTGKISILRNYGDDSRSEVVLDDAGFIYVAAQTQSRTSFPILPSLGAVFQSTFGGGTQDAAVIKIDPNCSNVLFSSYLGGSDNDGAYGIKVNPVNGNIYVVGATASNNFPGDKSGTIASAYAGGECDGYITIISNDGSTQIKASYLGTPSVDVVYALQFDNLGFPYIMGTTRGGWTVVNAAYSNSGSKQFISKLRPDLSGYVYSTIFGTNSDRPNISPVAFLVDRCENVYASGWGGWLVPGPDPYELAGTSGMPTTPDAIKGNTDGRDFYFIVIAKNAASLLYGSFFGQNGGEGEHVDGGTSRFDRQGAIYQAICANCLPQSNPSNGPYPTTPGVWGPTNLTGDGCDLNAVKIAFNFSGVESAPKAFIGGVGNDTVGCVPLRVDFTDTLQLGKTYEWDFNGDGVTDLTTTQPVGVFTYNAVGSFRVRLIAVDSNTCNIRDTAYVTISVRDDEALLDFNYQKVGGCQSLEFQFSNLSIPPAGKPFNNKSFKWDFGDGSPTVITGTLALNHTFPRPDTYKVKLILIDTGYCNSPDTLEKELRIAPDVDAQFSVPLAGCVPYNAQFKYTGTAGQQFFWTFGDGGTSTLANPTHLYAAVGTYPVKLVVIDSATCNIIDSVFGTITVNPLPTAAFTFSPIPAEENTPTTFFNNSIGGARYIWHFGDGDSTIKTTMDTVRHQYNATGSFIACLVTINQYGCPDTACNTVQAIIKPLLDVPNAFTPNRPGGRGQNHIVRPQGFGMQKVIFRIYNRWGQKLFETTDPRAGWDGYFKGVLQPMDVYVYTLEVEFTDGTKATRKGDITLIR
ncbi:MAG TPA: PKD domain-containing protein, partial [Chitinophagaceae bacterium]